MATPQEIIMSVVEAAGGVADYEAVVAALPYAEQQKTLIYCRALEQEGLVKRVVALNPADGKSRLTIEKVTG